MDGEKTGNGALVKIKHHKAMQTEFREIFTFSQWKNCSEVFTTRKRKVLPKQKEKKWGMKKIPGRKHIVFSNQDASHVYLMRVSRAFVRVSFRIVEKWYAYTRLMRAAGEGG